MEANEVQELQEHAEEAGHEKSLRPAAFTMSVVAVPTHDDSIKPALALADLVLESLEQLSPDWLDVRF